jgi:hypothetical protein
VAFAGIRVSKMARICIWITASPSPKNVLSESKVDVDNVIATLERIDPRMSNRPQRSSRTRLAVTEKKPHQ